MAPTNLHAIFPTGGLLARCLACANLKPGFEDTHDLPEAAGCLDAPSVIPAGSMIGPVMGRQDNPARPQSVTRP